MTIFTLGSPEAEAALRELESRRGESNDRALRVADETIAGVRGPRRCVRRGTDREIRRC